MFGSPLTSWEDLVKEFAQDLDASNAGAWPYVDLTAQGTGVHVDSAYGDTSCEEDIEGHELVEIEPKGSRGAYVIMERFARSRSDGQSSRIFNALNQRHPFSTFRRAVESLGILEDWYAFKNKALEEIAANRLRDCGVEFKDGKIICTRPENITVFESDSL